MGFWGGGAGGEWCHLCGRHSRQKESASRDAWDAVHTCGSAEESDGLEGRAGGRGDAGGVGLGRVVGLQCYGQWQLPKDAEQGWPGLCWLCPAAPYTVPRSHAPSPCPHTAPTEAPWCPFYREGD